MDIVIQLQLTPAEDMAARDPNPTIERLNRQLLFNTKIADIVDTYSVNFQSAGFLHDDGTQTRHYLSNGHPNNISGNHVYMERSWPRGEQDEYSTVRTGHATIAAVFDFADSQIYSYDETIEVHGNCGIAWEWVVHPTGLPTRQDIAQQTPQTILQYGHIIGVSGYLFGNVPPPLYPVWHMGQKQFARIQLPEWQGNKYRLFGYQWSYHMEAPTPQTPLPYLNYFT